MNEAHQSHYVRECLRYLRQQKGLTMFWLWLERWLSVEGWVFDHETSAFRLSPNASARFLLGAPRPGFGASGKPVFLGVQKEEEEWLSRMSPKKVIFHDALVGGQQERWLWLLFPGMTSPDVAWPDLPPLVLGVQLYETQLVGWQGKKMDIRPVWWDDSTPPNPRVQSVPIHSLDVVHGELMEHWNPEQMFVKTLRQKAIEQAESALIARGLTEDPGYQGAPAALDPSQKDMVTPFHGPAPEIVEANYHGLFGQFIDGVEEGPRRK